MKKQILIIVLILLLPLHLSSQNKTKGKPPEITTIRVSYLSDPYIINDKITENKFDIALFNTNIPGSNENFTLTPKDILHFWFIIDEEPNSSPKFQRPWGVTTIDFFSDDICKMEAGTGNWDIIKEDRKNAINYKQYKGWKLIPQENITISPGDHIKFTVSGLKSGLPNGPTEPYYYLEKDISGVGHVNFKTLTPLQKGPGNTQNMDIGYYGKLTTGLSTDEFHSIGFFSKSRPAVPLFEVEGGTGNTYVKGNIDAKSILINGKKPIIHKSFKGIYFFGQPDGTVQPIGPLPTGVKLEYVTRYMEGGTTFLLKTDISVDYVVSILAGNKISADFYQSINNTPDMQSRIITKAIKSEGFWYVFIKIPTSIKSLNYEFSILAISQGMCFEEPEYIMKSNEPLNAGEIIFNSSYYSCAWGGYFGIFNYKGVELFKTKSDNVTNFGEKERYPNLYYTPDQLGLRFTDGVKNYQISPSQ